MKLDEIDKQEFVSKLDGSFREKLYKTFIYVYKLGVRHGTYQDIEVKDGRELDEMFEKWLKEL